MTSYLEDYGIDAEGLKERVRRTVKVDVEPLRKKVPDASEALEGLLNRLLRKAVEQRPGTAAEVVAELEGIASSQDAEPIDIDEKRRKLPIGEPSVGMHSTVISRTHFED